MPVFRFVDGITATEQGEAEAPTIMEAYERLYGPQLEPTNSSYSWKLITEFGAEGRFNECGGTHVYLGKRYLRTIQYYLVRKNEDTQTPKPSR